FVIDADQITIEPVDEATAKAGPEAAAAEVSAPAPQPAAAAAEPSAPPGVARTAPARTAASQAADKDGGSIRVGVEKVDQVINLVGELVITQAMLAQTASGLDPVVHDRLLNGLEQLERNARDLQESVMSIRMVPMDYVFSRFPRVVRDVASRLGKKVELVTEG